MTATATRGIVDTWASPLIGTLVEADLVGGPQCVDSAKSFLFTQGMGPGAYGHARDFTAGVCEAWPELLELIPADQPAQPADTASWGPAPKNPYGHVATVVEDLGDSVRVVQQNPKPLHYAVVPKAGDGVYLGPVRGYARPRRYGVPAVATIPATVRVARGDTLAGIGRRHGLGVQVMLGMNEDVIPEQLRVGQDVRTRYVVRRGDTLSQIAERLGGTVETITEDNGLADPNVILPGQTLVVRA